MAIVGLADPILIMYAPVGRVSVWAEALKPAIIKTGAIKISLNTLLNAWYILLDFNGY